MSRSKTTPDNADASDEAESAFDQYSRGGMHTEIAFLVKMVLIVRTFRSQIDEQLRLIGHSATRMEALGAIINMQRPISQSDLANRLKLEGGTITRVIDLLSADGLVTRSPDANDRRINLLTASEKGEAALKEIFAVYDRMRAHVLQGIDEDKMKDAIAVFDQMLARIETLPGEE